MRTVTDHKLNGLNEALKITVLDEPGAGGACHEYKIQTELKNPPEEFPAENSRRLRASCRIHFQNGPIQEAGVNGVSNEALLAIVIDRLRSFQEGKFACRDNELALVKAEESLMWLQKRTRDRMARGVEGRSEQ